MIDVPEPSTPRADPERRLLVSEHAALRACAERLQMLLESLAGSGSDPRRVRELRELFGDFRQRLGAHLASEERSGVLERARAAAPRFERRFRRLRAEHGELRARIDALVVEAGGSDWVRLRAGFVEFHRRLRDHDEAEDRILLSTYLDDLGGSG